MPILITSGSVKECSCGTSPSSLVVQPDDRVKCNKTPVANIMDNVSLINVMPFGLCTTMANPAVAAADGVPQPCIPVIVGPWDPGSPTVYSGKLKAVKHTSKLYCAYTGVIKFISPAQTNTLVQ